MTELGAKIRAHRKRYGMSQAELSRRIHVSQTTLNLIEMGQTQDPRFSIIERIAQVLGLSLDQLVQEAKDSEYEPTGVVFAGR